MVLDVTFSFFDYRFYAPITVPLPLYLLWFVWVDTIRDQCADEGAFYVMLYMDADMCQLGFVDG